MIFSSKQLLLFCISAFTCAPLYLNALSIDPLTCAAQDDFYLTNNHLKKQNENPTLLNVLQAVHIGMILTPILEYAVLHWLMSDNMKESILTEDQNIHCADCTDHPYATSISCAAKIAYNAYNIAHWAMHIYNMKSLFDHIKQKLKKRLPQALSLH